MKLVATILTAFISCIAVNVPLDAQAQEQWGKARSDERNIGIEFAVCKEVPEQLICLALSCSSGFFELISIRSGSGAFTGSVQLSASGKKFEVQFSEEDPRIMDVAGASGSRAKVSAEVVEAILNSRRVTIRDPSPDGIVETYPTKRLKSLVRDPKGSCTASGISNNAFIGHCHIRQE